MFLIWLSSLQPLGTVMEMKWHFRNKLCPKSLYLREGHEVLPLDECPCVSDVQPTIPQDLLLWHRLFRVTVTLLLTVFLVVLVALQSPEALLCLPTEAS